MTNHLDELIASIADPSLRADLGKEPARLRDTKDFGLVYERHLPETSRLPTHPVRRGRVVCRRKPRGNSGRPVSLCRELPRTSTSTSNA